MKTIALGTKLYVDASAAVAQAFTVLATTDVFTITGHGYAIGNLVRLHGLTGGAGITDGGEYYVISAPTPDSFTVSATPGGTILQVTADGSGSATLATYIAVGNLTSVPVPNTTRGEVDATDLDSEAIEVLPTLPDNGSADFSGFYNAENAGQLLLLADAELPTPPTRRWRTDFVNQDTRVAFSGFVARATQVVTAPLTPIGFQGSVRITGAKTSVSPIPA